MGTQTINNEFMQKKLELQITANCYNHVATRSLLLNSLVEVYRVGYYHQLHQPKFLYQNLVGLLKMLL